jgi:hypothetical protein
MTITGKGYMTQAEGKHGVVRKALKVMAWIAGIWLFVLLAVRIVLTPSVIDRLVDKYASEYVDGSISIGEVRLSVLRHFPNIGLSIDDFSITYPADRYDIIEKQGPQGHLMKSGTGSDADTLASFRKFSIRANLPALMAGKISIPFAELDKPRIFLHTYQDGQSNLDAIKIPSDTTESDGLPEIKLGRISMKGHPHFVYTDSRDTIFAMADLKQFSMNGRLDTERSHRSRIGIKADSLFVAGRISADTLAFGLEHLGIIEKQRRMHLSAKAKTLLASRSFGRMDIPIEIRSGFSFPAGDFPSVSIHDLKAEVASIPLEGRADLCFKDDRAAIDADISIKECKASDIIDRFLKDYIPESEDFSTDATFTIEASCKGDYIYSGGPLPDLDARVYVPESHIGHKAISSGLAFSLDASATGRDGRISAFLKDLRISGNGLSVAASGDIPDILEDDFLMNVDGNISADLGSLVSFLPDTSGITAEGLLSAHLKGSARPSHLDIYRFSESALKGEVDAEDIIVRMPSDSIDVRIHNLGFTIGPEDRTSRIDSTMTFHLLALKGDIGSADISYGTMGIKGDRIKITAMNSADGGTDAVNRLGGRLNAAKLTLTDAAGMEVELKGTENGFQMLPKKNRPEVPMLTVSSDNDRIMLKDGTNRIILTDAKVGASAAMNTIERRQRAKAFMDSLARMHPEIHRDSLMIHIRTQRAVQKLPEWMQEEDFRKQDINIKLDETLAKYFREWDMNGRIDVRTGILMTPFFPVRNILRGFQVSFDNNRVSIDSAKVRTGGSEIGARGELTGLKRALLGRGNMNLDLEIYSDKVDANELLAAFSTGSRYVPPTDKETIAEASDAEFFKMVTSDTLAAGDTVPPLIVVPSNLNADVRLNGKNITYSDLNISSLHSKMLMKERCVQITETEAISNMGDISFEGFYATRSKKDIKAGFSFNFKDITAEKVIDLMPQVDSIMPLLQSFNGMLDCELAATASIDTNMNVIPPSINGIIRIGGTNLSIKDSEMFHDLAKKLMFKNKNEGHIDQMSVEGVISDSMLEVFPFIMKMDRYTLAMSGIHNMDESFKYHVSLLKSPFLIRLGIDLYGDNLDDFKFRIGKAKYKNAEVPVFSAVIDTTKINLVNSIRGIFEKGVENAINENERKEAIENMKKEIGYIRAIDQELEALSEKEQQQMKEEEAMLKEAEKAENELSEAVRQLNNNKENKE